MVSLRWYHHIMMVSCIILLLSIVGVKAQTSLSSTGGTSSSSSSGGDAPLACIPAGLTADDFCGSIVTWLIPNTFNATIQDVYAYYGANTIGACPYYRARSYVCRKFFPRCVASNTSSAATPSIYRICRTSSCLFAKTWDHGTCSRYDDSYFTDECSDTNYYSEQPCDEAGLRTSDDNGYWKWILVGVLGLIIIILLASYIRVKCRERMTMEDLDREEEERAKAKRARQVDRYQDLSAAGDRDVHRGGGYIDDDERHGSHHNAPSAREVELNERANRARGDSRAPPPPTADASSSSSSSSGKRGSATIAAAPHSSTATSDDESAITDAAYLEPTNVSINFA